MKKKIHLRQLPVYAALICAAAGTPESAMGNSIMKEGESSASIRFKENKNQWAGQVLFKAGIKGGSVFLEKQKLVYALYSLEDLDNIHTKGHHSRGFDKKTQPVRCHALYVHFLNANQNAGINPVNRLPEYYNYFTGNDPSKWASGVNAYKEVQYKNMYRNIDMNIYGNGQNLKYDFVVNTGGNPSLINLLYEGQSSIHLSGGNLVIATSVGDLVEQKPYAYQTTAAGKNPVKCEFLLSRDGKLSFSFPEGYNSRLPLVIDPVVIASTYSGSAAETYGHCATYDSSGNIYTAGECFDIGYPVTAGAFQTFFGGGMVDIAISKLNPTGSALIYATYIGGPDDDYPHSLFVHDNGELYVLGSTDGAYPITPGCYDNTFNGSTDIVVSRFNAAGTALIGSTYVGGSDDDGQNWGLNISYNYGDGYRGEIIVDAAGNAYIASCTVSGDFPVTAGAYNQTLAGDQDACVFKLNPALTSLTWSTFLGGSTDDVAFGLRLDAANDVYVTGATTSSDFPTAAGVYQPAYQGGTADGFVSHLITNGSALDLSTFYGTSGFDMAYFLDLDAGNNVYVYGVTNGTITPTAGTYANPGSGQFISKLNPSLNTIAYTTVFGNGLPNNYGTGEFSPSAFMVDMCGNIYASGWGMVDTYPVSPNAVQPSTDNEDFYLIVLGNNAGSLVYATYYGNPNEWEHVDGGTSRFDKKGRVYQAVCEGSSGFPATPGAYSPNNMTGEYDIAVFKIDFESVGVTAQAQASPNDTICAGGSVAFGNTSINSVDYIWNFGDGSPTDTTVTPAHTYVSAGTYTASLIAIDSAGCNVSDTVYLIIEVLQQPMVVITGDTLVCQGEIFTLTASGGNTYQWSNGATTSSITAVAATTVTYSVMVSNTTCSNAAASTLTVNPGPTAVAYTNVTIIQGQDTALSASGGGAYLWNNGSTDSTITVSPTLTTMYCVTVTDANGCTDDSCVTVTVRSPDCSAEKIFVPNAFSPNNDGQNEVECVLGLGDCLESLRFAIYDRWGEKIFETDNPEVCWDGMYKGKKMGTAVFVYYLNVLFITGEEVTLKGSIGLIR